MAQMSAGKIWWLAIRPKTLWASIAPVAIGLAMAFADGAFRGSTALVTLLTALLIQIGTNFSNDYSDFKKGADTAERKGPLRVTQAGLIRPEVMMRATALVFALAVLGCAVLVSIGGWPMAVIGIAGIASGIAYTAGPVPLGYLGFGDLLVLVFFGPVAVGGTYYLQTGRITAPVLFSGLAPGLLSVAILVVNNLRDMEGDRVAGKKTLAVRFGATFARLEYLFCIVVSVAIPTLLVAVVAWFHASILTSVVLAACSIPVVRTVFRHTEGEFLNPALGATARLLLIYSVLFSLTWCLGTEWP